MAERGRNDKYYYSGEPVYYIPVLDSLREYRENGQYRKALDSGAFQCVWERAEDGEMWCYMVINDHQYIEVAEGNKLVLTEYAKNNLSECALQFYRR